MSMELEIYQIDAFARRPFQGNPAAIVPLKDWLPDGLMQSIAMENNLSVTAFYVPLESGAYRLRWFTPNKEVDLCGHATLAAAFLVFKLTPKLSEVQFHTKSGMLSVKKENDVLTMNFPSDKGAELSSSSMLQTLQDALGCTVQSVLKGRDDYLVIVENEDTVAKLKPDLVAVSKLPARGVVVSCKHSFLVLICNVYRLAKSESFDFVSRCFYPAYGINEDPFTGSAHCLLATHWSKLLNKTQMKGKVKIRFLQNFTLAFS